ncbi:helix-turn-helix domain-containing protein [Pedobacter sp. AW1-32]|uniref:helix-turn-helix domain-containing protein n=1 Tax=Pedobacter sp. AW1-32 TaxID=3383026 RepID=UPI003FEFAC1D
MRSIGDNIKKCRISLGISQADAARLLEISTPAFCKIETGQTDLNVSRLFQISKVFHVPVTQLLTGKLTVSISGADQIKALTEQLATKDEEINKLRKKVIDLYDKLGL